MSNKRVAVLVSGVVLVLLILISWVAFSNKYASYRAQQTLSVPTSFSASVPYGKNLIVYSNGQSLMTYDYATGSTSQLSPTVNLSANNNGIDSLSVSYNDQYLLFHDDQVAASGLLYQQLSAQDLNPQNDYWWLYNTQTKTFQVLPQTAILAKIIGNSVYALSLTNNGEAIISYNPSNLSPFKTIDISGVNNFTVANNGFVLQTPTNDLLFTKDGVVSQELLKNATIVSEIPYSQEIAVVVGQGKSRKLATFNLETDKTAALSGDITGQPVYNSNTILYTVSKTVSSTSLYSYSLVTKKSSVWDLSSTSPLNNSLITPVTLTNSNSAVVSTSSSSYYLVGSGLAKTPSSF